MTARRTFEGRPLDRDDEELVDQGASFDLATLLSRRSLLSVLGLGAGAAVLAACSPIAQAPAPSPAPALAGELPEETAGPYPGDGSNGPDILERSGIVRSDIRSSIGGGATAKGVELAVTFTMLDLATGAPLPDVAVYAWQCDAAGDYSMYSDAIRGETYLRGVQVADGNGTVSYTSIFPACYSGRWPHIHFEVYPGVASITDSTSAIATSQLAVPESMFGDVYALDEYAGSAERLARLTLAGDMVFGDDGGELQMAAISGTTDAGFSASLTARIGAGGD